MARQTKGRLFKSGKKGAYHLQYYVSGRQFVVTLKDDSGEIITREEAARIAADKILQPVTAANKAEQLKKVLDAVETAEMKLERAEAEAKTREDAKAKAAADRRALKVADAWKKYTSPDERLAPECSERNLANYRGYWRLFTEWLAEQPEHPEYMRDVTETLAKRFANHLEKSGASGNTFNKYRAFLLSFFKVLAPAIRGGGNPFEAIRRKEKVKAAKRRDLTADELRAVLGNAKGETGLLLWIGATTGLRLGDAVTLTWSAIDLHRGIIRLDTRKTATAVVIGIVPVLAELLAQMPPEQRQGYLMPTLAAEYLNLNIRPHFVARLQRYFQSCGIQTWRAGTGPGTGKRAVTEVGFHSLRHSFATICGEVGTAESVTQKLLGHSRAAMTQYYQHSTESAATATAKQLDGAFRGLLAESGEVIDTAATAAGSEPERAELRRLIDTMEIGEIRAILRKIKE